MRHLNQTIARLFARPRHSDAVVDTHFHFGPGGLHVCDYVACDSPRADPADR